VPHGREVAVDGAERPEANCNKESDATLEQPLFLAAMASRTTFWLDVTSRWNWASSYWLRTLDVCERLPRADGMFNLTERLQRAAGALAIEVGAHLPALPKPVFNTAPGWQLEQWQSGGSPPATVRKSEARAALLLAVHAAQGYTPRAVWVAAWTFIQRLVQLVLDAQHHANERFTSTARRGGGGESVGSICPEMWRMLCTPWQAQTFPPTAPPRTQPTNRHRAPWFGIAGTPRVYVGVEARGVVQWCARASGFDIASSGDEQVHGLILSSRVSGWSRGSDRDAAGPASLEQQELQALAAAIAQAMERRPLFALVETGVNFWQGQSATAAHTLLRAWRMAGYLVTTEEIDSAAWFGTAQSRVRVFLLATCETWAELAGPLRLPARPDTAPLQDTGASVLREWAPGMEHLLLPTGAVLWAAEAADAGTKDPGAVHRVGKFHAKQGRGEVFSTQGKLPACTATAPTALAVEVTVHGQRRARLLLDAELGLLFTKGSCGAGATGDERSGHFWGQEWHAAPALALFRSLRQQLSPATVFRPSAVEDIIGTEDAKKLTAAQEQGWEDFSKLVRTGKVDSGEGTSLPRPTQVRILGGAAAHPRARQFTWDLRQFWESGDPADICPAGTGTSPRMGRVRARWRDLRHLLSGYPDRGIVSSFKHGFANQAQPLQRFLLSPNHAGAYKAYTKGCDDMDEELAAQRLERFPLSHPPFFPIRGSPQGSVPKHEPDGSLSLKRRRVIDLSHLENLGLALNQLIDLKEDFVTLSYMTYDGMIFNVMLMKRSGASVWLCKVDCKRCYRQFDRPEHELPAHALTFPFFNSHEPGAESRVPDAGCDRRGALDWIADYVMQFGDCTGANLATRAVLAIVWLWAAAMALFRPRCAQARKWQCTVRAAREHFKQQPFKSDFTVPDGQFYSGQQPSLQFGPELAHAENFIDDIVMAIVGAPPLPDAAASNKQAAEAASKPSAVTAVGVVPPERDHQARAKAASEAALSKQDRVDAMALLLTLMTMAGLPVSDDKLEWEGEWSEVLTILGIEADTARCRSRITESKRSAMLAILTHFAQLDAAGLKQWQSLLGRLIFAARAIPKGRLYVTTFIQQLRRAQQHGSAPVTAQVLEEINFWLRVLREWDGSAWWPDLMWLGTATDGYHWLSTDASTSVGAGGFFKGLWFSFSWEEFLPSFVQESCKFHIGELEAIAAWVWLCWLLQQPDLQSDFRGKRFLFRCDNMGVVQSENNLKPKDRTTEFAIKEIHTAEIVASCEMRFLHIDTHANAIADAASRDDLDAMTRAINERRLVYPLRRVQVSELRLPSSTWQRLVFYKNG
jgi:hypothetical protein